MIKQIKLVRNNSYSLYYSSKHLSINWHEFCYILVRGDEYETKMQYIQTLKQTLKLNQKLLKSLDFLTDNIDDINKVVQQVLETNPF